MQIDAMNSCPLSHGMHSEVWSVLRATTVYSLAGGPALRRQYMMASSGAFLCSHSGRFPASRSFRAWVYLQHAAPSHCELCPLSTGSQPDSGSSLSDQGQGQGEQSDKLQVQQAGAATDARGNPYS